MTLGVYIRTKEHDEKISKAKKEYYSHLENIKKHLDSHNGIKWYEYEDYSKDVIKRKGVLYYRFPCVDCEKPHYAQKIKGNPRNPRCSSCASIIRGTGRICNEDTKSKISKSLVGHPSTAKKGWKMKPEQKDQISKRSKGNTYRRGKKMSPESIEKMRIASNKYWSEDKRKEQGLRAKKLWQDPNFGCHKESYKKKREVIWERMLVEMFKANPMSNYNKTERKIDELMQEVIPNEYKYNGGGQLGFKIFKHTPDFVNVNGQKKIINFNGCAWHGCKQCNYPHPLDKDLNKIRAKDEKDIENTHKLGYEVLIIWTHDLKDKQNLINKIKEFNGLKPAEVNLI